jgi:hypothetical protein
MCQIGKSEKRPFGLPFGAIIAKSHLLLAWAVWGQLSEFDL